MANFQPVIKWTGSKRKQSEEIISHFPKEIDTYYEPFLGGGSVMYRLLISEIKINNLICSDVNEDLINLWNMIKIEPKRLAEGYESLWNELNKDDDIDRKKEYFNTVRARYNANRSPIDFLFISRTCVNGKIRYNRRGEFNNSFHVTRNGIISKTMAKIINDWSEKINSSNVSFVHQDYSIINAKKDDYIYLDPPYAGTTDMYYGGIDLNKFYEWLGNQKCKYALSFDGTSGEDNYMTKIPIALYDKHIFIENGNSTFKKVDKGKNEMVSESLYIKEMLNVSAVVLENLKKDLSEFGIGVVIAELINNKTLYTLETNGEHDDVYLEIVEYDNGLEQSFSDPIYEMPNSIEDINKLFNDFTQ